jgi:hypothetical protein
MQASANFRPDPKAIHVVFFDKFAAFDTLSAALET